MSVLQVNTINEVTSANGVTIDGLSLKDGNVVPASGKGIDFSAASSAGGSSSAVLDDYEEGTWTPSFLSGSTYFTQQGNYIKIGRLVTCQYLINNNAALTGGTNVAVMQGFPFEIHNATYSGTVSTNNVNMSSRHVLWRRWSATQMGMIGSAHDGTSWAWITANLIGANKDFFGIITYWTD